MYSHVDMHCIISLGHTEIYEQTDGDKSNILYKKLNKTMEFSILND